jgi:(1->4)-alpha-D-glucan 1-alpha-D-glucosylmutase
LNDLEDVLIDRDGFAETERTYKALRRLGNTTFHQIALAGKRQFLEGPLRADVLRLVRRLLPLVRARGVTATAAEVTAALTALLTALPVYRTYVAPGAPIDPDDRAVVERAVEEATTRDDVRQSARVDLVQLVGILVVGDTSTDDAQRLAFVQRLQQVSGPATAKGIEDTALYAYVPLVSRNEVGGSPDRSLDHAVARLHDANAKRAERWPRALLATNTHDTKRSADVRARLDVLSEMPQEWARAVKRWRRLNQKHRRVVKGRLAPDTNTEYLLYQTLVALWPPPRAARRVDDLPDRQWRDSTRERLRQYMLKAAREAKTRTSWIDPDAEYERALADFIGAILEPGDDAPCLADVARLVSRMAAAGSANALSRIALHLTSPGTPDIYQGDEVWNFTLVDPDNRRPVDYGARAAMLGSLDELAAHLRDGADVDWFDARLKLLVTHRLLTLRRERPELFARGSYTPLAVSGKRADHVIAFERTAGGARMITVATRLPCTLVTSNAGEWWGDTAVEMPNAGGLWTSRITGVALELGERLDVSKVLHKLPAAVLAN